MSEEMKDDWKLDKIELEFKTFGENAGKYVGKIRFENGDYESFSFKIRPNMAEKYIELLSGDIVKSASDLGDRLIKSLGLDESEDK